MNLHNKMSQSSFLKYDLSHESLAAAASGLRSFADLDKRCIAFAIHLDGPTWHEPLCRALFGTTEAFFTKLLERNPRVSHCGLFSALDVNGSKFSGADRDPRQSHCHGCIFIPHGISAQDVARLLGSLLDASVAVSGVKSGSSAIHFALFDRNSQAATLAAYVAYALKEAVRTDTVGTIAVYLPFDYRAGMSSQAHKRIKLRQREILRVLGGPDRFKIYR